ncbi:MAG: 4-alpha-glucanotransferase [Gemmataceae bacterium]
MSALFRSSGFLLHPTSLPGPFGIGDLGPAAYRWVDTLAAMKQRWWQILPLGPTGLGNSPYMSFSAFAGNINLLSPEQLERDGLVSSSSWQGQSFRDDRVDFEPVIKFKSNLLRLAFDSFRGVARHPLNDEFQAFCERERAWLHDYAFFMAIREALGNRALVDWPVELLKREPVAMGHMERSVGNEIRKHQFGQFLFDRQWSALKKYAEEKNVKLIGDVPIFVALDSADVWSNPKQFLLDGDFKPQVVAGVPPDYFSADGQLWGNPIYDWSAMKADGYQWWIARIRRALVQTDLVRLDHFRGFAQAWHVPAGDKTAKNGTWVDGPGLDLFRAIEAAIPCPVPPKETTSDATTATTENCLPLIAEDLGLITPDVVELRDTLGLPGMKVLQFAVGDASNPYQPHNYVPNCVCYTGTHDNDTTPGWYGQLNDRDKQFWNDYCGHAIVDPGWQFIQEAWKSVASIAIAPLQDLLGLGQDARMNTPGIAEGNWSWRFRAEQFRPGTVEAVSAWTERYRRVVR